MSGDRGRHPSEDGLREVCCAALRLIEGLRHLQVLEEELF